MNEELLNKLTSMSSYWDEILKRDEPRKTNCCNDEIVSLVASLDSVTLIHLLNEGVKSLKK